jgi:Predicted integral membrane protein (DUF2269)
MTKYSVLVFFHVASVIVWVGTGTAVALVALYAARSRDRAILDRLDGLVAWLGLRVLAPASLSALGFGIWAAHTGGWPRLFWFKVGEAAFAVSFLTTATLRIPLLRRARRGSIDPLRLARSFVALGIVELTVLYIAVGDMVVKPSSNDTTAITAGAIALGAAVLGAAAVFFAGGGGGATAPGRASAKVAS